jgi:hypothetical protein
MALFMTLSLINGSIVRIALARAFAANANRSAVSSKAVQLGKPSHTHNVMGRK